MKKIIIVNPLDQYINKDVVKHFVQLIHDLNPTAFTIRIFSNEILNTIHQFSLKELLPDTIDLAPAPWIKESKEEKEMIDRLLTFLKEERSLVVVKADWLDIRGSKQSLREAMQDGANIHEVKDILGAMVVASRKRRNNVVFPIKGYEDEALITAAGLAKAKTVGFRRFYVWQHHKSTPAVIRSMAQKQTNEYYLIPLKTGLNTGAEEYAEIPLLYQKGVVISGYEAMDIMQSIYMLTEQMMNRKPSVVFQRIKEVSEEAIMRARWMIDEVFEYEDIKESTLGRIPQGKMKIKEKYNMFDAARLGL